MAKTTRRKITPKGSKLIKSPTCIKGFDEITQGGLPQIGTTLVSGNGAPEKKLQWREDSEQVHRRQM